MQLTIDTNPRARPRTASPDPPTNISPITQPSSPISNSEAPVPQIQSHPILTHNTHPTQVPLIPVPPPVAIDFEDNVDVIALKCAIQTLQTQKGRSEADILKLRDIKEEAKQDPEKFAKELVEGRQLPERIKIVRCPPVKWHKYAIHGGALEDLHKDQVRFPVQGQPATYVEGKYEFKDTPVEHREEYVGIAQYNPFTEREKAKKTFVGEP